MSKLRYKREFTDNLSQEEFDEEVSEMATLKQSNSHLPYMFLIDYDGKNRRRENNIPRIMISLDNHFRELIPISIDKYNPEVLIDKEILEFEVIKKFIVKHYEILIRHWNQELDDLDALELLSK